MAKITETIAPFCFGYLTQYWFGTLSPMPNKPLLETVNGHRVVAFSEDIGLGVVAYILQNGLVRFDMEKFKGNGVIIYRYEDSPEGSRRLSAANLEVREKELQEMAFRLIQIHAVLLDNARRILENCASYASRPNRISEMLRGYDVTDPIRTLDPDFKYWYPLSERVARRSLEDLRKVVLDSEGLFQLVELYSFSLTHFLERRFSEALILYWAAIEASINVLWNRLLSSEKEHSEIGLSKQRKDRLTGPNSFTASVMIESLYLLRLLPSGVYEELGVVRKRRNDWMHKLQPIDEKAALEARKACENLIRHVFAFDIEGTIGGPGGAGGGMYKEVFSQRYPNKTRLFEFRSE
ncbi:hypothetical protein [Hydrogenophaga pseudoflava]|uniref:hypothetical protein n=1 Tax=Hydrogenophaga pseudoflava TaxID=47421 RepID=UPI0027E4E21A|nr:hypothetical protein [Hydrogenophaga pseudoflava]MDQ7744611.1 hypothetical protein [Hydrogenophaga pseudoflava]